MRSDVEGTVYLIHLERPYRHARHYIGWTERDVEGRLAYHRSGQGSKLLRAVARAGIGWRVVRTWRGTRHLERRLKRRKCAPRMCPACIAEWLGRDLVSSMNSRTRSEPGVTVVDVPNPRGTHDSYGQDRAPRCDA